MAAVNWSASCRRSPWLLIPGSAVPGRSRDGGATRSPVCNLGRTALRAALILGLLIAGWHLPLIIVGQVSWTDIIQIMGAAIDLQLDVNNARGSVSIIMLSHAG